MDYFNPVKLVFGSLVRRQITEECVGKNVLIIWQELTLVHPHPSRLVLQIDLEITLQKILDCLEWT